LELSVSLSTALVDMESLVLLHTLVITVFNILALANCSQNVSTVAPLAYSDHKFLSNLKFENKLVGLRISELCNDQLLLIEIYVLQPESRVDQRFKTLTRKFYAAIDLYLDVVAQVFHLSVILSWWFFLGSIIASCL
jgi:hypothetical protein